MNTELTIFFAAFNVAGRASSIGQEKFPELADTYHFWHTDLIVVFDRAGQPYRLRVPESLLWWKDESYRTKLLQLKVLPETVAQKVVNLEHARLIRRGGRRKKLKRKKQH